MSNEERKPLTSITAAQARELLEAYKKAELSCMFKEFLWVISGQQLDCVSVGCSECPAWLSNELERLISEGYILTDETKKPQATPRVNCHWYAQDTDSCTRVDGDCLRPIEDVPLREKTFACCYTCPSRAKCLADTQCCDRGGSTE